jgi:Adenylyl/Guanylyl and SMODS C-terminal sensor domain
MTVCEPSKDRELTAAQTASGQVAESQIVRDQGTGVKNEPTRYRSKHYVECYVVKDGVCAAAVHQTVVIK